MRLKLLSLISLSSLGLVLMGLNPISPLRVNAEGEIETKTIYVDLSLSNPINPVIKFKDRSTVELTPIGNYIYQSDVELSLPISSFCIEDGGLESPWVDDPSIYNKDIYNYLCLGPNDSISYGYYGPKVKNPGATYATQRVWLMDSLSTSLDPWSSKGVNAVGYHDKDNQYQVTIMESIISSGTTYYFADMPADETSFVFLSLSSKEHHDYAYIRCEEVSSISYGCCYALASSGALSTVNAYGADAGLLAEVVSAYLTYGKNPSNGCTISTLQSVYHTFFANKSATDADLKNAKILDYTGYAANGNSYEGLTKSASFSVNEKWNTMCSQAGIDSKTGQIRGFDFSLFSSAAGRTLIILIAIAVVAGIAIGAIPFIRLYKRKRD